MAAPPLDHALTRRRFLAGGLAAAGVVAVSGPTLLLRPARAAAAPGRPRLSFGADPRRELTINWSTPEAVAGPRVELGLDEALGTTVAADTGMVAGVATNYHTARLTGLDPGTTYRVRIHHDGGSGHAFTIRTAPDEPERFRFAAFGDQGVNGAGGQIAAMLVDERPQFTLVAGDLSYANSSGMGAPTDAINPAVWDAWFAQNSRSMAISPWIPAMGNHDMEAPFGELGYGAHLTRLGLPAGGLNDVVHAFRYGNVAVLTLDANDVSEEITALRGYTGGAQDRWIDSTLRALRADPAVDFIVAQFHHCSYCTIPIHASDGGPRLRWGPLFERYGVDLIVNGHNHGYERCHPIKADLPTVEAPIGATIRSAEAGPTYVCAGGGGQVSYPVFTGGVGDLDLGASYVTVEGGSKALEVVQWSSVRVAGNSFLRIDVTPPGGDGTTTMAVTALSTAGVAVDQFTLSRTSTAVVAAPAAPVAEPTRADPQASLPATGGRDVLLPAAALGAAALAARRLSCAGDRAALAGRTVTL